MLPSKIAIQQGIGAVRTQSVPLTPKTARQSRMLSLNVDGRSIEDDCALTPRVLPQCHSHQLYQRRPPQVLLTVKFYPNQRICGPHGIYGLRVLRARIRRYLLASILRFLSALFVVAIFYLANS